MNKITLLLLFLFIGTGTYAQRYIDMTEELSNITGNLVIDGNTLQAKEKTKEQIIITGENMVLNHRSSFLFQNVLVQLSGKIIVKGDVRPLLLDSYIFCKDAGPLVSKKVLNLERFDDIYVGKVDYIAKLNGNPVIHIYSAAGKRVFKGTKSETTDFKLPIAMYDVKVVGVAFKSKMLFIN